MAFTTPTYLLFLSLIFVLYWSSRTSRLQNLLLLVGSYIFYATWDARLCLLLLATSLLDYGVGLALARAETSGLRRALLIISISANLGALVFFKYFNFFAENFQRLAQLIGWRADPLLLNIILPVGISFYTFKSLSYTIDVYRRHFKPTSDPVAYLTYVAFFPQLLAGPIDRAGNLLRQLLTIRRFSRALAVDGCRQMLWGFFKKMMLADNLAPIVNLAYTEAIARPGPHLLFATLCFAFQIYCDFSAYSDIAIGSGKLLGLESIRNFAYPYFSQSPAEFWRRWHISLTSWFRDYVYFPLGGVRGSAPRKAFNILLTFILSGLWHGASWNFLIWGGVNGVMVVPELFLRRKWSARGMSATGGLWPSLKKFFKVSLTFFLICLTWVFFRAQTTGQALLILKKIFADALKLSAYRSMTSLLHPYADYPLEGKKMALFLLGFICVEWLQREHQHPLTLDGWPKSIRWLAYHGLIFLVLYFGAYSISQFYYFRF